MDADNNTKYATNVLQLDGGFSNVTTANTAAGNAAKIDATIYLLELQKGRSSVGGAQAIGANAFYIQVTCDINAHVSAHPGNTAERPNVGETGQSGDNADDIFSLSEMVFQHSDFDAPADPTTSSTFTQKAADNEPANKAWKTATGATLNYKLPHGSATLKMGHIAFTNNHFKVNVEVGATVAQARLNQYSVQDPVVTSSTGGSQTAQTTEDITVAQYLYVSKTDVAGVTRANANSPGKYTDNNALADAGIDSEEAALDSIRQASGQSNNWGKTEGATAIDQLEDKLSTSVTVAQVESAYANVLLGLKNSLGGASSSIITAWTITVDAVDKHESSLLSKFGRSKGDIQGDKSQIFDDGDKIVVGSFNNGAFSADQVALALKATPQQANSANPGAEVTILSGPVIALVCQKQ